MKREKEERERESHGRDGDQGREIDRERRE
jgi:hypothetical protein